jgi:hypothetical protein
VGAHTLTAIFDRPHLVGDVYVLSFDRTELDVGPTHAMCRRCRMLTDDSFESMFTFFTEIEF